MAVDKKATLTYVQLMKEDLAVFRLVPEDGVIPDYETGQFITLGMPIPSEDNKIIRRAYSIASHPENKKFIEKLSTLQDDKAQLEGPQTRLGAEDRENHLGKLPCYQKRVHRPCCWIARVPRCVP